MNTIKSCDKLEARIPGGRLHEIKNHAQRYDGGSLDRFILRAIDIAIQRDLDVEKVIDESMSRHWAQEAEKHRWDGVPEECREYPYKG